MKYIVISFFTLIIFAMTTNAAVKKMVITSASFTHNGIIPVKYSCEGNETNPPLHISHIPPEAKSLAVIVHDPDAPHKGGFTHWVVWNIGMDGNIPEDFHGAQQGMNSGEKNGYKGMCPPDGVHHYSFRVYALDTRLNLDHNTTKEQLEKAMEGHVLAEGEIIGLFRKIREGQVK